MSCGWAKLGWTLGVVWGLALAAPATYDQRQHGELNVKLDLDNFVVLVARPSPSLDLFGSMAQLFADARKAHHNQHQQQQQPAESKEAEADKALDDVSLEGAIPNGKLVLLELGPGDKQARSHEQQQQQQPPAKYKLVEAVDEPHSLRLVGDALENCGPGRSRDAAGICQSDNRA